MALAGVYLLIAVGLALLGWSGLWSSFSLLPPSARVPSWATLVLAVPACGVVLLKRRAPVTGLVVAAAFFVTDLLTVGGVVPLLVLLEMLHAYTLALPPERRRRLLGGVIAATLVLTGAALVISSDARSAAMIGLQFGALLGLTYWYANSVAQSRELVEMHRRRAEDAERIAELDRVAAVEGERDRMARELHDVVAGHISAIAIRSEAALGLPAEETSDRRALRAVRDASLEAHATLREMIQVLRSGEQEFSPSPGRARVPGLVAAAQASGARVSLTDTISGELPAPVDHAVGRIVQEGLANAMRHAAGAEVAVRLSDCGGEVRVEVSSAGGGAPSDPELRGSGMGLEMLAERTRAVGGEFTAGPAGPVVPPTSAAGRCGPEYRGRSRNERASG